MDDQLKFELGNSQKALEHLHNALKEIHAAMAELTAPPDMSDEKPKVPVDNRTVKNPWHQKLKSHYMNYYKTEKKSPYYFQAKDGAAINRITKKLEFMITETRATDVNPDILWQGILHRLKEVEPWVYENLNLTLIDSKLNDIVAKMKGSNSADYKQELLNRMS